MNPMAHEFTPPQYYVDNGDHLSNITGSTDVSGGESWSNAQWDESYYGAYYHDQFQYVPTAVTRQAILVARVPQHRTEMTTVLLSA